MSSLFLIKGQWGSDVPGLEPSEGGQPQMWPDSELDPSSISKRIHLDWYERKILKSKLIKKKKKKKNLMNLELQYQDRASKGERNKK